MGFKTVFKTMGVFSVSSFMLLGGIYLGRGGASNGSIADANVGVRAYDYNRDSIPAYPGALEYPMGEDIQVNETPIKMSYFYTNDSLEEVRSFYVKYFRKKSLTPVVEQISATEVNIYALSTSQEEQFNISILDSSGQTLVFPAIIPVNGKLMSGHVALHTNEIPFSEDAIGIVKVASAQDAGGFVSYIEPKFDVLASMGYIRDSLGKKGWQINEYKPDFDKKGSAVIELSKHDRFMKFSILQNNTHRGVMITVNLHNSSRN